jgi:hypothetical protein
MLLEDSNRRRPVPKSGRPGGGHLFVAIRQWLRLTGIRRIFGERDDDGRPRTPANSKQDAIMMHVGGSNEGKKALRDRRVAG